MRNNELNYNRMAELHINKADETVGIYAVAFLDAASKIFEHGICDFAPYPGVFCLRHGLELFVKQMTVYQAYELRNKQLLYKKGHGLLLLWDGVKPHIEACVEEQSCYSDDDVRKESVEEVDAAIRYLGQVDPGLHCTGTPRTS